MATVSRCHDTPRGVKKNLLADKTQRDEERRSDHERQCKRHKNTNDIGKQQKQSNLD